MTRIGWIGLGKMGVPMALNIQRAGYELSVWNRSKHKSDALRAAGAQVIDEMTVLAAKVDVLFVMVSDDVGLRRVAIGEGGTLAHMREGAILVDMSTVSADISAEVAELAASRGVQYLRAPVSGSVSLAAAGELTILASGPREVFDRTLPILETLSAKQSYVGANEQARILKLAINMMVGISAAMLGEAMALGLKNGLERTTMLEVMGASTIASQLIGYKIEALKARDYTPTFEVVQMAKDFDLVLGAGRGSDTPMPITALVREGWSALIASGEGDQDFFKYVEMASQAAGLRDDD